MEWVAISFSKGSSWSRNRTYVSCIATRVFTTEPLKKPITYLIGYNMCRHHFICPGKLKNSVIHFIIVMSEWVSASRSVVSDSLRPHGLYSPWNSSGQNIGVGSLSLLQGIFLTWGSNLGLPHCGWILYQLSHKWSPRILEWIANPFSKGSSQSRNRTGVSCIAGRFFIIVYTLIIYTLFWWSGTIENAQYLQCLPALQKIRLQKCW